MGVSSGPVRAGGLFVTFVLGVVDCEVVVVDGVLVEDGCVVVVAVVVEIVEFVLEVVVDDEEAEIKI